ncbi:hypothetical protein JTE90_011335 [Oedothorax gibbosus]|uniref:Uncharacterized protein n=1 Tax=Oedothorax gibbosus TaxID=931172 RepID=A0AAV6VMZ3_9ARAC|nr:hypothetical protein JTE90_011335 [Oedothorax gibbosus]
MKYKNNISKGDIKKNIMMFLKILFCILLVIAITEKVSLKIICSDPKESKNCHNINPKAPVCSPRVNLDCKKACNKGNFECRYGRSGPLCYCDGLPDPIDPFCPIFKRMDCSNYCSSLFGSGALDTCINRRNKKNVCFCKVFLDDSTFTRKFEIT